MSLPNPPDCPASRLERDRQAVLARGPADAFARYLRALEDAVGTDGEGRARAAALTWSPPGAVRGGPTDLPPWLRERQLDLLGE